MDKKMYFELLEMDRIANGMKRKFPVPFYDYNWIYLRRMRRIEYLQGKQCTFLSKIRLGYNKFMLRQLSVKCGITLPPGVFGGGVSLYHYGSVICNNKVKAGKFVTIQSDVNISENVILGDNVYLAPGSKVLANVEIAEGVIIGANAVVTKSIKEAYTSWAGIPARKISNKGYIDRTLNEITFRVANH